MENRLLARLSAICVLSLTAATMILPNFLTVNAQKPSSARTRDAVRVRARQVFRNDIVHGQNKEANDNDLMSWLDKLSDTTSFTTDEIRELAAKLGNGFGTEEASPVGIAYVLPAHRRIKEVYIAAEEGSDFESLNEVLEARKASPIGTGLYIRDYERLLRLRMDNDSSGSVSEDEFVDYASTYFDYKTKLMRYMEEMYNKIDR